MKSYTTKANAKRAAKTQGIDFDIITFVEVDGKWSWEEEKVIGEYTYCPHCEVHLSNGVLEDGVDSTGDGEPLGNKKFVYYCMGCNEEFGPEVKANSRSASSVSSPCQLVWEMADSMLGARRKDVLEACVEKGIAYNTARTQYQAWRKANKA